MQKISNKPMKILITAGPTWVRIDEVRILTSIFTGKTGLYLAQEFIKRGHKVTLLGNLRQEARGRVKLIPFTYFDDFKKRICQELKRNRYDVIIHSAAVSDYVLHNSFSGKIPSGKKSLELSLKPAEKIIKLIRKLARNAVVVQFKLEMKRKGLLEKAYKSLMVNKSDLVVANAMEDLKGGYQAFILDRGKNVIRISSKKMLVGQLMAITRSCQDD